MCLIIHRKEKQSLAKNFLDDVFSHNKDGWGIMFLNDDGAPVIKRGMKLKSFYKAYKNEVQHRECLIHFRMATQGDIDLSMCHPFEVTSGIYNIDAPSHACKKKSDTWRFVNLVLKPILESVDKPHEFLRSESMSYLIASHAGTGNRLAFLDHMGAHLVPTESEWSETTCGVTVSNTYAYNVNNPDRVSIGYTRNYGAWSYYDSRWQVYSKKEDVSSKNLSKYEHPDLYEDSEIEESDSDLIEFVDSDYETSEESWFESLDLETLVGDYESAYTLVNAYPESAADLIQELAAFKLER
jgi:hypothetical protein